MKKASPIWLKNWRETNELGGKIRAESSGESHPNIDGPKKMPAIISPITVCWPSFRMINPNILEVKRMTITCSSRILMGYLMLPRN